MAVEYKDEMPPGAEDEGPMEETGSEEVTASLPVSILAGKTVSPGDVVRLEVVNVDDQNGNVTVKYASEPMAEEAKNKPGVEGMAAEFD